MALLKTVKRKEQSERTERQMKVKKNFFFFDEIKIEMK